MKISNQEAEEVCERIRIGAGELEEKDFGEALEDRAMTGGTGVCPTAGRRRLRSPQFGKYSGNYLGRSPPRASSYFSIFRSITYLFSSLPGSNHPLVAEIPVQMSCSFRACRHDPNQPLRFWLLQAQLVSAKHSFQVASLLLTVVLNLTALLYDE